MVAPQWQRWVETLWKHPLRMPRAAYPDVRPARPSHLLNAPRDELPLEFHQSGRKRTCIQQASTLY